MPHIDPQTVLWFSVVSSVVTGVAALGAFITSVVHFLYVLRRDAKNVAKKL